MLCQYGIVTKNQIVKKIMLCNVFKCVGDYQRYTKYNSPDLYKYNGGDYRNNLYLI